MQERTGTGSAKAGGTRAVGARDGAAKHAMPAAGQGPAADGSWHLARSLDESGLAAFEFSLERAMQAYYRWKGACLAAAGPSGLTGNDTAVLNVIRMREQPKSLSEIARLLNRDDMSNIQYALRKLASLDLVEKTEGQARKTTTYRVTEAGFAVTERYAELRAQILLTMLGATGNQQERRQAAGDFLDLMAGLYDQAAGLVTTRRY